jgi:hypothetical protein
MELDRKTKFQGAALKAKSQYLLDCGLHGQPSCWCVAVTPVGIPGD